MNDERRKYKRSHFQSPIRYQKKGSQQVNDTLTKDISAGGIGFITNEFIPKNTQLVFEFNLPNSSEYVTALGEVAWIAEEPYSERFSVGAKFLSPLPVI